MKITSQITIFLFLFISTLVQAKTDIVLEFPNSEYNSMTGNYTRNYCATINSKISTNLGLSRKEIHTLIKSIEIENNEWATMVNDREKTQKIVKACENNRPPKAIIYVDGTRKTSFKMINCTESSTYANIVKKLIVESHKVLALEPSSCEL